MKYVIAPENDAFVAQCLDVEVASDGDTEEAAVANLKEALELYFEDARLPGQKNVSAANFS